MRLNRSKIMAGFISDGPGQSRFVWRGDERDSLGRWVWADKDQNLTDPHLPLWSTSEEAATRDRHGRLWSAPTDAYGNPRPRQGGSHVDV